MKTINVKTISNPLSNKEMRLIKGGDDPANPAVGGSGMAMFRCEYTTMDGEHHESGCIFGIGTATALCEFYAYNDTCTCSSCDPL